MGVTQVLRDVLLVAMSDTRRMAGESLRVEFRRQVRERVLELKQAKPEITRESVLAALAAEGVLSPVGSHLCRR